MKEGSQTSKSETKNRFDKAYMEARESKLRQEEERVKALSDEKNNNPKEGCDSCQGWMSPGRETAPATSPANASSDQGTESTGMDETMTGDLGHVSPDQTKGRLTALMFMKLSGQKTEGAFGSKETLPLAGLAGQTAPIEGELKERGDTGSRIALAELIAMEGDLIRIGSLDAGEGSFTDFLQDGTDKNMNPNVSPLDGHSPMGLQSYENGLTTDVASPSPAAQWRAESQIVERSVMNQVTQKLMLHRFDISGSEDVTLELTPKELGALKIEISVHKGIVSADILTQTVAVKEILEKNQALLHDALTQSGFNIDHFSVNIGDFGHNPYSADDNNYNGMTFASEETHYSALTALARVGEILGVVNTESGISIYV